MVGAIGVVAFMIASYGFFGLLATVSLTVNVILLIGLLLRRWGAETP